MRTNLRLKKTTAKLMTQPEEDSPWMKAKRTGIWAKTMAKWHITYLTRGSKKWRFVSFEGEKSGEDTFNL